MISFGPFSLYPGRRWLERDGVPVKLGARSLDILLALVEKAGSVVSKNDLMARIWPDVVVDESALRVHMASLRKALGDGQDGARYLSNVSGRGYAFVADIAAAEAGDAHRASHDGETKSETETAPTNPTNLPQNLTPIIGRSTELTALWDLADEHRLVTLTGMGGIGKTRLAIELGVVMAPRFAGGVWVIDLAPLTDPSLVPVAAAAVLGVSLTNPEKAVETIAAALTKPTLLIFDNCEHLVGSAASLIDALLPLAPGLSVIATSQEPLRITPEHVYSVDPLALPPPGSALAHAFGAVELFVARGRAAVRGFQLNDANAPGVAEICRRLEGIPLALEMAAARLPMFGVEGLRGHLNEPMRLLKFSQHAPDVRHRTLRDMVEWSHGLLDETERQVFRRLANFAGSFSLEAAVAVAGAGQGDAWETMDALGRLAEKSLVIVDPGEPPRYYMLETLRVFAFEKLHESGESAANAERHANFFALLMENAEATDRIEQTGAIFARHASERDNIRAALDWAFADPLRRQRAIAMAGAAVPILYVKSYYEVRRYVDQAILLEDEATPPADLARLLTRAGALWSNSDRARALSLSHRAAEIYRRLGSTLLFGPLRQIGLVSSFLGRFDEAKAALIEARAILLQLDQPRPLLMVHSSLGNVARNIGDIEGAKRHYEDAIDLARSVKDTKYELFILLKLAELEFQIGNIDRAVDLGSALLRGVRQDPQGGFLTSALANLTAYILARSNTVAARPYAEDFFTTSKTVGGYELRISIMQWALIGALEGHFANAALLAGFVDNGFKCGGEFKEPTEKHTYDQLKRLLNSAIPAAEHQALEAEGASWTEDEAAGFVLSRLISPEGPEAR